MPALVIRRRRCTVAAWLSRAILGLMLFLPASDMQAAAPLGNFRCDKGIVSRGDRMFDVLVKCGEPTYRSTRYEKRIKKDFFRDIFPDGNKREEEAYREPFLVEEFVEIQEWAYNFGSLQFIRYLTFENGILVVIEIGDYGF